MGEQTHVLIATLIAGVWLCELFLNAPLKAPWAAAIVSGGGWSRAHLEAHQKGKDERRAETCLRAGSERHLRGLKRRIRLWEARMPLQAVSVGGFFLTGWGC